MEMNKFYCCKGSVSHNYQTCNLIDPYHFWGISPRNLTLFTRPFLAGGVRGLGTRYQHLAD